MTNHCHRSNPSHTLHLYTQNTAVLFQPLFTSFLRMSAPGSIVVVFDAPVIYLFPLTAGKDLPRLFLGIMYRYMIHRRDPCAILLAHSFLVPSCQPPVRSLGSDEFCEFHLHLLIPSAATGSIGSACAAGRTHGAARFASSSEHFCHLLMRSTMVLNVYRF